MKNLKFIAGIILSVLFGMFLFLVVSFKSESTNSLPQSSSKIKSLNSTTDVYKLYVDNTQYIVVVNNSGGTAIVKHQ